MSERNRTVNRIVQGTGLYESLNARLRRALVAMLGAAYDAGRASALRGGEDE